MAFTVFKITDMTRIVTIREGNDVQTCYTMDTTPQEVLKQSGIVLTAYDTVDFTGFEGKLGEISITRAFPVNIRCDGKHLIQMVTGGTIADVLQAAKITLGEHDLVNLPLEHAAEENDEVVITRQRFVTRHEEIELPYETLSIPSSLLKPGEQKVLTAGESGLRIDSYSQMFIDGNPEEEYLLGKDTIKEPVTEEILTGFASRPVSPLEFNVPFDENGEPSQYVKVLRSQRSAGYSASPGAKTASGRSAAVGHVAVNPKVIPYGTRLFIQSSDQKFVYGYAVAADTGTALAQGIIDVDLFYASYDESVLNGIRAVDIYILENE